LHNRQQLLMYLLEVDLTLQGGAESIERLLRIVALAPGYHRIIPQALRRALR
jgi:hypothetical protein